MIDDKKEKAIQIGEILAVMAEMYDKQMSSMLAGQYLDVLMGYDIEVIRGAAKWLTQNHTHSYMPRPAQFVDACKVADANYRFKMQKLLSAPNEKPGDPEYGKLFCRLVAKALRDGRQNEMDIVIKEINEKWERKKKAKSLLPDK